MNTECNDPKIGRKIDAYNLGVLKDDELQEVEIHLLQCEHCMKSVRKFREISELLIFDDEVRQTIQAQDKENMKRDDIRVSSKKKGYFSYISKLPRAIPISLVVIILVLILILNPWHFEFQLGKEAIAFENRLAIMYFDNLFDVNDNQMLGEIVTNLLISDLSESKYIQVVSSQRLHDILRILGWSDIKEINKDVASKIAERARARWMLLGSITKDKSEYVLMSQLVDVATGNSIASQRIRGSEEESIFNLADKLSSQIRSDLSLPADDNDRSLNEITTNSYEAYKHYLEGVDYFYKMYTTEAIESFENALKYDSTFAMSYYYLSRLKNLETKELAAKAFEYSEKAGTKDQFFIRALNAEISNDLAKAADELNNLIRIYEDEKEAYYMLCQYQYYAGRFDSAISYASKAIQVDSLFKAAYNVLAYSYGYLGDSENAIKSINTYIRLAPDEANPYDSRGDLYLRQGNIEKAIDSYELAIKIKSDFYPSVKKLLRLNLYQGEFSKATNYIKKLKDAQSINYKIEGELGETYALHYQGKFREAIDSLNNTHDLYLTKDSSVYRDIVINLILNMKISIFSFLKNYDLALKANEELMELIPDDNYVQHRRFALKLSEAHLLAMSKRIAEAESTAEFIRDYSEENGLGNGHYLALKGFIELEKENYSNAIQYLENVTKNHDDFLFHYGLGYAYFEAGMYSKVIEKFEDPVLLYNCLNSTNNIYEVIMLYYLARASEEEGQIDNAIKYYRKFIYIWRNADSDQEILIEAKEHLRKLIR
jgi:tetratricopeptide (TPR) repeat protein